MSTGLQLATAGGLLAGLGLALLLWRILPTDPDLTDALDRLTPEYARRQATAAASLTGSALTGGARDTRSAGAQQALYDRRGSVPRAVEAPGRSVRGSDGRERLGVWAVKTLPPRIWGTPPLRELAILRISPARFYGEKLLFAFLGLVLGPLLAFFLALVGIRPPFLIPVLGSLGLAAVMFFLPDYNARDDAQRSRGEFSRALGAYIELVALERRSGSGSRQALERAATVGDSWVFRRLAEELRRSRWSGTAPWDALHLLADELGVPELDDLADIMRLSGEEGAQVYANLRARGDSLRDAMLSSEVAKANAISTRLFIPASLLGVIFMAILLTPALLRISGA